MEAQDGFAIGAHANPSVFNNPKDFDIILRCGDHQFYAHRVILRLWSPFFERALNSGFPVAKSAIFHVDNDDPNDHEYFGAMLKHIYGLRFEEYSAHNDPYEFSFCSDALENFIRVYMMADKYDIPILRGDVIAELENFFWGVYKASNTSPEFNKRFEVPKWIAKMCGPGAPRLANPRLRDTLFSYVYLNYDVLMQDPDAIAKINDGSLLDAELTAKLLCNLGTQIERMKKEGKA
ncbi:hypothetical protein KCU65_g2570, partial [Aureobasidium melanogenum]